MQNSIKNLFPQVILLFALILTAILGSPFRFADGNSGRYLPTLYRQIDSELFPNDPVADAFERFKSLFYTGVGSIFKAAGISPLQVEPVFYVLYMVSKAALVILLLFFTRALKKDWIAFFILAAWTIHSKSAGVGYDSMFAPSFTHATIAALMGILALSFLLHNRPFAFAFILGCAAFIHSIISLHLAMLVFITLFITNKGRLDKSEWGAGILFGAFFIAYFTLLSPPAFSPQEANLFLQAKGEMGHISPLAQSSMGWVSISGKISLAWLLYFVFFQEEKSLGLIKDFMLIGALTALLLGAAAAITGNLQASQLQPMRMFEWVNFFSFTLLSYAISKTIRQNLPIAAILLTVILLNILDSLWGTVWIYLAITVLGAEILGRKRKRFLFFSSLPFLISACAVLLTAALALWAMGDFHSFESLREPIPVIVILLCFIFIIARNEKKAFQASIAALAIIIALIGRSIYVYDYIAARQNEDFKAACQWIAKNTPKNARFITAINDKNSGNFRARALRMSINEGQSALYWVAPLVGEENGRQFSQVQENWNGERWNVSNLFSLAKKAEVDFILIESEIPEDNAIYRAGNFYILSVP